MQEPIRYYITKSGEEPTVRSVKVALNPANLDHPFDLGAAVEESQPTPRRDQEPQKGVQRLVSGAIRKRPRRP